MTSGDMPVPNDAVTDLRGPIAQLGSFVEYSASRGLQTFKLSWRNPTSAQGDWTLDTYVERVLSAIDTVREVAGTPDTDVFGLI